MITTTFEIGITISSKGNTIPYSRAHFYFIPLSASSPPSTRVSQGWGEQIGAGGKDLRIECVSETIVFPCFQSVVVLSNTHCMYVLSFSAELDESRQRWHMTCPMHIPAIHAT